MARAHKVTFPKAGEKQRFESVIRAERFILDLYKGHVPKVPKRIVIIFDHVFEKELAHRLGLKAADGLYPYAHGGWIARNRSFALLRIGIGAPLASVAVEELIAMGARSFLILGTAGGLEKPEAGRLVLCTKALRDEGTSHHYLPNSMYVEPDKVLTGRLVSALRKERIEFIKGPTWTIDAPYMESKEELDIYASKGILTVEMEAAAVFAVAKVRKAKAAAAFVVSDVLTKKGWSGFVAGRRKTDFENLAAVARLFARVGLGKNY
ncbi:MAG: nucleoside phosphorylase [Nitrososphaerales archaeon]|nr:nucleoside phosphorylase [Nitrososphaerales archaeon]